MPSLDGVAHQISLSLGLASYALNATRQTLISANKEGLVSLTGMYPLVFRSRPCAHSGDQVILRYTSSACLREHL
jgi:hypothetical protein